MRPVVLPAPPSANKAHRDIRIGPRAKRVLTGAAKRWRTRAVRELRAAGGAIPVKIPCAVRILATLDRRRDVDNCVKPILDAMERAGVIVGDNWVDDAHAHRADGPPGLVSITWCPAPRERPVLEAPPDLVMDAPAEPAPPPPKPRGPMPFEAAWDAAWDSYKPWKIDGPNDAFTRPVWIAHACAWRAGGGPEVVAMACRRAAEREAYELPQGWDLERKAAAIQERVEALPTSIRELAQRGGLLAGVATRERNARRDAEIRRLVAEGESQRAIARQLGISHTSVYRVMRRVQPQPGGTP